jgi:hypothetical protein
MALFEGRHRGMAHRAEVLSQVRLSAKVGIGRYLDQMEANARVLSRFVR